MSSLAASRIVSGVAHPPHFQTHTIFSIALVIMITTACVSFTAEMVILAAAHADTLPDPFTTYESVMPGQPSDALALNRCQRLEIRTLPSTVTLCEFHPGKPPFLSVTAAIQEGQITDLVFRVGNSLSVGDLVQRWGRPDEIETQGQSLTLQWDAGVFAITEKGGWGRFHYRLPVQFVSVSRHEAE